MSQSSKSLKTSKGLLKGKTVAPRRRAPMKKTKGKVTRSVVAKIAKDVIESQAELKYLDSDQTGQVVGQVVQNGSGHNTIIFSYPVQGNGANQRDGDQIKLKSLKINTQYWSMASTSAPVKIQCYLVWMKNKTQTQVQVANFLENNSSIETLNPGVLVYDTGCFRNREAADTCRVIAAWEVFIPRLDNTSASAGNNVSHTFVNKEIPLNLTQTFAAGTAVNSLVLYTFADCGNAHATTASTLAGLPMNAAATGVQFQRNYRLEYIDL